jgi:hypothetical protein
MQADESKRGIAAYGRRILVEWETTGMPPDGRRVRMPVEQRTKTPLAFKTIERLKPERFRKLCDILANPSNWTDV